MTAQADAEAYICHACDYAGYGGWNCYKCGGYDLMHTGIAHETALERALARAEYLEDR